MDISVVIATYKRKEQALKAMRSFSNQARKAFEMVVVDQGPDFLSDEEISELERGFTFRYLRMSEPGLTRARNEGIRKASGEIVLFCDDDIEPDEFLVERHLENYKDPGTGGIAGRVISAGRRKNYLSLCSRTGAFNPFNARPICNFHLRKRGEVEHVNGCNMSFRKEALVKAGLFDESLKGTANLEDADIAFRVRMLGYKIFFEPQAVVKHLELAEGGCQKDDSGEFVYWLYFTDTLFYLRYFRKAFLPLFLARLLLRIAYFAASRMEARLFERAGRGFKDAVKKYAGERKAVGMRVCL